MPEVCDEYNSKSEEKEGQLKNCGRWEFPEVDNAEFKRIALKATRIFASKVVIATQPSMKPHIKEVYLDEEPDLREHGNEFTMPESDANEIVVDFGRKEIFFCPHLGRGDEKDDECLAEAIVDFQQFLNDQGVDCKSEIFSDDPGVRKM